MLILLITACNCLAYKIYVLFLYRLIRRLLRLRLILRRLRRRLRRLRRLLLRLFALLPISKKLSINAKNFKHSYLAPCYSCRTLTIET